MGGYVLGMVNPLVVAGVAAAALSYAAYEGSKELSAYQKALTLTGGYAGVSAGQLGALAESIGKTNGTTGVAAETLASLASSGKIAGESFDEIATAAVAMNQATGKAVQDTVAEFVRIGDDPVSAAKSLNSSYHFLTASVYEQIETLLAVVIALQSGLRMVVLDRFDGLDMPSRTQCIGMLLTLAKSGEIESAVVCGTLKEKPAKLPPEIQAIWIANGIAGEPELQKSA